MMNAEVHYIEDENLSVAWARAVRPMLARGGPGEIAPMIVAVTGFDDGVPREDVGVRRALDKMLVDVDMQPSHTVANTLFPESLWNRAQPRAMLFDRYRSALPRLRKASTKNTHGLYFERMITGGPETHPNQLDFIIETYTKRKGARRSGLQVGVFDPKIDQTPAAQLGFPCLQHVTFAPTRMEPNRKGLCVNGFYATQYAFERAYGNYLGLCRLGRFVAQELGVPLVRMTCFTGILLHEDKVKASDVAPLAQVVEKLLADRGGVS